MKFIKGLLLALLVVVVISTGVYAAANRGLIHVPTVPPRLAQIASPFLDQDKITQLNQSFSSQLTILASRAQEVGQHTQKVLGASIEVNSSKTNGQSKPIHERAFEYARYEYCQQVIRDYQANETEQTTTLP